MENKNFEKVILKNENQKFKEIYIKSSKKIILGVLLFISLYIIFLITFVRIDNKYKNSNC